MASHPASFYHRKNDACSTKGTCFIPVADSAQVIFSPLIRDSKRFHLASGSFHLGCPR
jgi:hypothetical protein